MIRVRKVVWQFLHLGDAKGKDIGNFKKISPFPQGSIAHTGDKHQPQVT
jgi:hypothetical protein